MFGSSFRASAAGQLGDCELANAKRKFSKIVIHVSANDFRLRQPEITKNNVKKVCELANTMSDTVICSGLIVHYRLSLVSPILSQMEFCFLAAVASGLLSLGHLISSDIVDLIAQILFKLN